NQSKVPRLGLEVRRRPLLETLEDRTLLSTFFVAAFGGNDANPGTSPQAPFQSIEAAVNASGNGDVIKVAGGTYGYNPAQDRNVSFLGPAVVSIFEKQIAILGGYTTADGFAAANPTANLTVIDGGGAVR